MFQLHQMWKYLHLRLMDWILAVMYSRTQWPDVLCPSHKHTCCTCTMHRCILGIPLQGQWECIATLAVPWLRVVGCLQVVRGRLHNMFWRGVEERKRMGFIFPKDIRRCACQAHETGRQQQKWHGHPSCNGAAGTCDGRRSKKWHKDCVKGLSWTRCQLAMLEATACMN